MINIKKVLSVCLVCVLSIGIWEARAGEEKKRNFHEFELWHKLLQYSLSPSGEWAMWRVQTAADTDTLFVRNLVSGKEYKYKNTSAPRFSEDSRWMVFSEPGDPVGGISYQVRLVSLPATEERIFKGMESFTFTPDSRFLILKGRNAADLAELNLYDLGKGQIKNVANIREYTTDPSGKYLAYILKTEGGRGNAIEVMDLSGFRILYLESGEVEYEKLKWTTQGLVFMKVLPDSVQQNRNREICVIRNVGRKPETYRFCAVTGTDFPAHMKISELYVPHWSADGKSLFFGITPKNTRLSTGHRQGAGVDVWHWQDREVQSRQRHRYYADRSRTYLCVWWPEKEQWRQLADSALSEVTDIAANGAYVLAEDDRHYRPHFREPHRDIYVIQTSTGKRVRILENTILSAAFSKEGKYVYYFKDEHWWAYEPASGRYIDLTEGVDTGLSDKYYDGPINIPPSYGQAGWLKGDKAFWFYDEYDIWSVEPATLKLKRLTAGREKKITFRKFQRGELTPDRNLLLKATGEDGQTGIWRFDPAGRYRQWMYGAFSLLRLERSADKKTILFARADNITAPELYVAGEDCLNPRQLTRTNLDSEGFVFRKSELVHYRNAAGKKLKGALFYPLNYQEGKKYPMIVHVYERTSHQLNAFVFPSAGETYNPMNYVLQGYFVFQPDITYTVNQPGESAVDCIESAVNEVLKRGDIDARRLGLIGHSWGAYQTAYAVTQTSLFAAAVAGAPLTDMVSMYNSVYWENGRLNQEMFETSQARFRSPWWEIPQQYVKNSPVFQAEKIETPLLMIFGTEDQAVDWSQGLEMYITMRRLGKPCILLAYRDEGHTIGEKANTLDQTLRVSDYFDHYLKGKPAAEWIRKGCTYLKKKGEE